jgi:hypothetical protein
MKIVSWASYGSAGNFAAVQSHQRGQTFSVDSATGIY